MLKPLVQHWTQYIELTADASPRSHWTQYIELTADASPRSIFCWRVRVNVVRCSLGSGAGGFLDSMNVKEIFTSKKLNQTIATHVQPQTQGTDAGNVVADKHASSWTNLSCFVGWTSENLLSGYIVDKVLPLSKPQLRTFNQNMTYILPVGDFIFVHPICNTWHPVSPPFPFCHHTCEKRKKWSKMTKRQPWSNSGREGYKRTGECRHWAYSTKQCQV